MQAAAYRINTPLGEAACTLDPSGVVTELALGVTSGSLLPAGDHPVAMQVQRELDEYFAGRLREFSVPLKPRGTVFQLRVWTELAKVSYGSTISYSELAQRIGDVKAVRAVGRANGANPVWILIPCHRVIGADGSLTGYAGGMEVKRRLLEIEGAIQTGLFG